MATDPGFFCGLDNCLNSRLQRVVNVLILSKHTEKPLHVVSSMQKYIKLKKIQLEGAILFFSKFRYMTCITVAGLNNQPPRFQSGSCSLSIGFLWQVQKVLLERV